MSAPYFVEDQVANLVIQWCEDMRMLPLMQCKMYTSQTNVQKVASTIKTWVKYAQPKMLAGIS